MKQFSLKEKTLYSGSTYATHTYSVTSESFINELGSDHVTITPPTIKVRYNTSAGGRKNIGDDITLGTIYNPVGADARYHLWKNLSYNTDAEMTFEYYPTYTVSLDSIFGPDNQEEASVPIDWIVGRQSLMINTGTGMKSDGSFDAVGEGTFSSGPTIREGEIRLNAPPTFDSGNLEFNTPDWIYTGLTTASVDISNLSAKYGGYIASAVLKVGNYQSEPITADGTLSLLLNEAGENLPVSVIVTDSRGQITTKSFPSITVNAYNAPEASMTVERTDEHGVVADEGTYAVITSAFNWTSDIADLEEPIAKVDGVIVTADWYTDRALTTAVDWSDTSSFTSPKTLYAKASGFRPNQNYQIGVMPIDSFGSGTERIQTLPTAFYTTDFLAGGHGIAFGMPSEEEGFFCNMDAYFKDKANVMRALFDFCRPVWSTYQTLDANFNPNDSWGGRWEKLPEGYILLSGSDGTGVGDTYVVGTDTTSSGYKEYGANDKRIEDANIAHGHGFTQPTISVKYAQDGASGTNRNRPQDNGTSTSTRMASASGGAVHDLGTPSQRQNFNVMQKSIAVYTWIRTA